MPRWPRREPTPHEIELGRRMLRDNAKWADVCDALQCTTEQARRWLDPEYKIRRRGAHDNSYRAFNYTHEDLKNPVYDPRRDGPRRYANPADELMGDPPIGRRAIDMRGGLVHSAAD